MNLRPAVVYREAAIVFMDVVGFSRLMSLDELGTHHRFLAIQTDVIKPTINGHDGRLVKTIGDGILAEFDTSESAVGFAISVQRSLASREAGVILDQRIILRIGIHFGRIIEEQGDIFGECVNIASRLEALAEPGTIALSTIVKDGSGDLLSDFLVRVGLKKLKNIPQKIDVWLHKPGEDFNALSSMQNRHLVLPEKPSIVVLPFTNLSRDVENYSLADGLCEDIITGLSKIKDFFVIARNTSFVYKGRSVDVRNVSQELGVRYLLEGSVRRSGERLRVTTQLIDATVDASLWAEQYDETVDDVFEIQDRITQAVIGHVGPTIHLAEYARFRRNPPNSIDAWGRYVQALCLCSQLSGTASEEALTLCEEAVSIDPNYAQPYGLSSWTLVWRAFQGWLPMPEAIQRAEKVIEQARTIDKDEQWSYLGEAMIAYATRSPDQALSATQKAIELNPNMAFAASLHGVSLTFCGMAEDALTYTDNAMRLSPKELFCEDFYLHYAFAYIGLRNFDKGLRYGLLSHRGRPNHPYPIILSMICAAHLNFLDQANELSKKLQAIAPMMTAQMLSQTCPYSQDEDIRCFNEGVRLAEHR